MYSTELKSYDLLKPIKDTIEKTKERFWNASFYHDYSRLDIKLTSRGVKKLKKLLHTWSEWHNSISKLNTTMYPMVSLSNESGRGICKQRWNSLLVDRCNNHKEEKYGYPETLH